MLQLKARDYKSSHKPTEPYITLSLSGIIAINALVIKILGIIDGDRVIVTRDDDGDYFIGKAKSSDDPDAYKVRHFNKSGSLQFNAKGLVVEIAKEKDLALAPEKKTSIRLPVITTGGVQWNGIKLYQVEI